MKKNISLVLVLILLLQSMMIPIDGQTDLFIETDPINQVYNGHVFGSTISANIQFNDVSANHWAKESVSRMGALEIIKGYNGRYQPAQTVSKEVALTMIIRAVGMEADAITAAEVIAQGQAATTGIEDIWARGYMQMASNLGLITPIELADALVVDQTTLDPEMNFLRQEAVTREQVAKWLIDAIEDVNPGLIPPIYTLNEIYRYTDIDEIAPEYGPYIEAITAKKIMQGSNNAFNPKGALTRAELAVILKNLDTILFDAMGYSRYNGTVGKVNSQVTRADGATNETKEILVRTGAGLVDQFNYSKTTNPIGTTTILDTPVLKNGSVVGLTSLAEGDVVEYIVKADTNELVYVHVKTEATPVTAFGQLQPMSDINNLNMSIKINGVTNTFKVASGVYDGTNNRIIMNDIWYDINQVPVGSYVTLTMLDNVIMNIKIETAPTLFLEVSGIVKSINTVFKYITIVDWNGKEITKNYVESNLIVEKQHYYDPEDEIGYIDEMYPDFRFDERDSTISTIEAGDVVHMRLDSNDTMYVTRISAKTNYVVKYGRVKEINYLGAEGANIMVTFMDNTTATYDIGSDIAIKKLSKNVTTATIRPGDTIRMLLNQAVLAPGTVSETVKEIVIDGYGNQIEAVHRGKMGTINQNQNTMTVLDSYTLARNGWSIYNQAKQISLGKTTVFYYEGKPITLNYAMNYLVRDDLEVYLATEDYYGKEIVTMVSIREGRDSVLGYSNITYSNGFDTINLLSEAEPINIDEGTIVIKNDRLVQVGNILSPDYARVILNGASQAAVVMIEAEPGNDNIDLFRGRIATVDDGTSFKVHSHAALMGMEWIYSPIERVFSINNRTVIIDEDAVIPLDQFITYSEISKVDEVYTIIADGDYASHIIKNPYAKEGVTGEIYEVTDALIMIKDVLVYKSADRIWEQLSVTNSYAQVDLLANSVIIKNNEVIDYRLLEPGDSIRVITTEQLKEQLLLTGERNIPGYIILVER